MKLATLLGAMTAVLCCGQGVTVVETRSVRYANAWIENGGNPQEQLRIAMRTLKGKIHMLRAFAVSDGDVELLQKTLRAPAVAVVRVSGLPSGRRVALEAILSGGNNPNGLLFLSGQPASSEKGEQGVLELTRKSLDQLEVALKAAGAGSTDVLQLACFASSVSNALEIGDLMESRFGAAARSLMQIPVPAPRTLVECEAVARARRAVGHLNPEGLPQSPNYTQVVGVASKRMAIAGLYRTGECNEAGSEAMFRALQSSLGEKGADVRNVAMSYLFPASMEGTKLIQATRFQFYDRSKPPGSTLLPFAGLPGGSCAGVAAIAPLPD